MDSETVLNLLDDPRELIDARDRWKLVQYFCKIADPFALRIQPHLRVLKVESNPKKVSQQIKDKAREFLKPHVSEVIFGHIVMKLDGWPANGIMVFPEIYLQVLPPLNKAWRNRPTFIQEDAKNGGARTRIEAKRRLPRSLEIIDEAINNRQQFFDFKELQSAWTDVKTVLGTSPWPSGYKTADDLGELE